jgi:bifunctional non-homologous end joining protein LigD
MATTPALDRYRKKRDFTATAEPSGGRRGRAARQHELIYVVQRHEARRLHYDFRLEWNGVLLSWAVPKGPSLDPEAKRLAVHVEDHPVEYASFQGDIPKGHYGAGHVAIWDSGIWIPHGDPDKDLAKGHLRFDLEGGQLAGGWMLIRMKREEDQWILRKLDDAYVVPGYDAEAPAAASKAVRKTSAARKAAGKAAAAKAAGDTATNKPATGRKATGKKATSETAAGKTAAGKTAAGEQPARKAMAANAVAAKKAAAERNGAAGNAAEVAESTQVAESAASRNKRKTLAGQGQARATAVVTTIESPGKPGKRGAAPKRLPLPEEMEPQLATLVDAPPPGADWTYEIKYDGYRMLCRIDGSHAAFVSRNDIDWTARMKGLATAIGRLRLGSGWLDGEVVVFDEQGVSSFQALQNALDGETSGLVYVVFDVPFWEGMDLRDRPLHERQAFLEQLLEDLPEDAPLMFTQRLGVADGAQANSVWTEACRLSLEGLICKRVDAPYRGGRTRTWLKLKCRPRQEFVIGGYTSPSGSRAHFGALLLGVRDGGKLKYAGRTGTGFNAEMLASLIKKLKKLHRDDSPFDTPLSRGRFRRNGNETIHWVAPELVAEIAFAGWTSDKLVRQASFLALREDKEAAEVGVERPMSAKRAAHGSAARSGDIPIAISHPDRLVYRSPDITKLELARYYAAIAPSMLPHVANRRLALLRCPDGTAQTCFFQKHLSETAPPEGIALDDGQIVIVSATGLLSLVQRGVVEFHTWGSSTPRADRADRITIDLDPDPNVGWPTVVEAAQLARTLLEAIGLKPYLKTTGGKGLHLVAPIKPTLAWDEIKQFAQNIALHLARMIPERFTANMSKQRRRDRVFVDYLRNGNGATAVAAFSARARQGAPVSMPMAWDDLSADRDLRNAVFNIRNAVDHVAAQGNPWASYEKDRATVTKNMRSLVAPRA